MGGLARATARRRRPARRRRLRLGARRDRRRRPGRGRRGAHGGHGRRGDRARAWATTSRPSRPASWRSPTSSSSTRPTATASSARSRDLEMMLSLGEHGELAAADRQDRGRPRARGSTACWPQIERHREHLTASGELDAPAPRPPAAAGRDASSRSGSWPPPTACSAWSARSSAASQQRADPYRVADRLFAGVARGAGRGLRSDRMIESIDHIGIAVRSIEEARKLYEALGLARGGASRRCRTRACGWP